MTVLTWNPSRFGGNTSLGVAANWGGLLPTAIDTLNFNSGAIITTLTGTATALDADFSGVTPWTLAGAQLILGGLLTVNAGATLSGNGTVTGTIADNGTIKASGGLLTLSGSVGGTGLLQIDVGATLDVNATSAGETISFLDGTGVLVDHQAGTIGAAISGFVAGDTIDLSSLSFAPGATATIAGGVLTVTSGAASETLSLTGIGNGTAFSVTADAGGTGTDIALVSAVALPPPTPPPPPVTTVPTLQQLVQQNVASAIGGISVADAAAAAANESLTAILSDTTGLLSVTGAGVTTGAGTTQLTISGTLAQVNAELATLSFLDATFGSDTISIVTTDIRGASSSNTIAVSINAPVVTTAPGAASAQAGLTAPIGGISVADADAVSAGETVTVVLSDTTGLLSATGLGVIGSGTTQLKIAGTLAQVNADLATLNFTGNVNDTVSVLTSDGRGASDSHTVAMTVNAPLRLVAGPGNVTLTGGAGNDTLVSGTGVDTLIGGLGNDTYLVNNALDVVTEAVGGGTDTVFASVSYTLAPGTEVEIIRANGAAALTLTGNEFSHTIVGGAGSDTLIGGIGNDTLIGGTGVDTMVGGLGNDTYLVNSALDVVTEAVAGGTDTVFASVSYALAAGTEVEFLRANGAANLTLSGNQFSHTIVGGAGIDTLNGGAGNDTLIGGTGVDTMVGGLGNDTYLVNNALDVVTEAVGGGTDTVFASVSYALVAGTEVEALRVNSATGMTLTGNEFSHTIVGGAGSDTLNGGVGNDTLTGGAGNDTLNGGAGNDTLNGGAGADTMAGGAGNDTYLVDNALDVVNESVGGGTDAVFASVSYALAAGTEVEALRANGAAALTLTGNEFSHTIVGGAGIDTLIGGVGNDTLIGGTATDTMAGGIGNDTYLVNNVHDVVTEAAGGGTDTIFASVSYALAAGTEVEALRANSATGLTLTGNAFSHTIVGGVGNDTLIGGVGNDTLNGGAGIDTMTSGLGNDTYLVDNALDVVNESVGGGTDTVFASVNYALSAGTEIEFLRVNSATGLTLTGNEFANTLVGNVGNDTLRGGAGNDTLNGGAGNDVLDGGIGNDTMTGGVGSDVFQFLAGFGHDIITDFSSNPVVGVDLLDISSLGITAATFASSVTIAASGVNTLITIGANSIQLNGVAAATVSATDFRLAP
jgi:Ca2+-binding RTX toxin-like protein